MTPIAAVIFDFDGVIADSERLHLRAFQDAVAVTSWTITEDEYYTKYLGWADRDVLQYVVREKTGEHQPALVDELMIRKERRYAELSAAGDLLYPAAERSIRRLGESFTLAIASGALTHEIVHTLEAAGLVGHFGAIVGADTVQECKPSPEPYLEAARRIAIAPDRCVAVEDSPWGLESARAAGMFAIGITNTYPADRLIGADVVVRSLYELDQGLFDRLIRSR